MKEFYMTKSAPVVETSKGKLRGFYFDGVYHFFGIRYAKARRFHKPEPVAAWEGVKDAGSYGMICPVLNEPVPTKEVFTPHRFWPSSEHCQYLNVWTASCDKGARMPVMFWIHGGAYAAGSSIEQECYDGFQLARLDGVVVVSVNHRLNAFGYLDMSDFGGKYQNSVNAGMADLVEALRWVRENIAAFGGDPDNVTVFGQSGGGCKVTVLGQIPEAEGLFHKMIVMSGVIPDEDFGTDCSRKDLVLAILDKLNISGDEAERLEKVPEPLFVWAVNAAVAEFRKRGMRVGWCPKPNGYYLCDPLKGDFTPFSLTVPTIVGTVLAEFCPNDDYGERAGLPAARREEIVKARYGAEGGEKILDAFREAYPGKNEVYAVDLDDKFLPDTVEYVKKKAAKAGAPVYNYMFAKVFDCDGGRAAWHCADIPYFFHNAQRIPVCHQENGETLERLMSGAFVSFAKTGDPNVDGLPRWDRCGEGKMVTMVFDDECYTKVNMQDTLLPLLRQYKPPYRLEIDADDEGEEGGSAWVF